MTDPARQPQSDFVMSPTPLQKSLSNNPMHVAQPQDQEDTIFDNICKLQDLIQIESELMQKFQRDFREQIDNTLVTQVQNYARTMLTFQSDLELFRYTAMVEQNPDKKKELRNP